MNKIMPWARLWISLLCIALLSGCAHGPVPENVGDARWMPEHELGDEATTACVTHTRPPNYDPANEVTLYQLQNAATLLTPGDRLRIRVIGDDDRLSSVFVVDEDGRLNMPGLPPIQAQGQTVAAVERRVSAALVDAGLVRRLDRVADVLLIESAGVSVSVNGAVFNPGSVRVGERDLETRVGQREGLASGDANVGRSLAAALRSAGGVRPDADIEHVYLAREHRWTRLNLESLLQGHAHQHVYLIDGDRIFVPTRHCFQPELVRPTAITQPGIRVFMSNLSRPANNNAGAAIGKESTSLPYGTRFLQALVSANCVGGAAMNARRHAVLISRNPINGHSVVIERDIENLVRQPNRDDIDPYLLPGDALACYDSRAMNARDALSVLGDVFGTAASIILIDDIATQE